MSLPEEEELEEVPEWLEGQSFLVQNVYCPWLELCGWHRSYIEGRDQDQEELRKEFEEHYREHHG